MKSLEDISIEVVNQPDNEHLVSANVLAILNEVATMLDALLNEGLTDGIDLRSLPLLPGEYEALKTILGEGEVSATIQALGPTKVYETQIAGVWWITHDNENSERVAELIEVTRLPSILQSDDDDIETARTVLKEQISEWATQSPEQMGGENE